MLDTHALLWWLEDDRRLGAAARDLIADSANDILIGVVSLWEIVVKVRIGKLDANVDAVIEASTKQALAFLDIQPKHLRALVDLPTYPDHRDPFDHLLLAQAIAEGATFVSADRHASRYPVTVRTCS